MKRGKVENIHSMRKNADFVCCLVISIIGHLHRGGDIAVAELPGGVSVLHLDVLAQATAESCFVKLIFPSSALLKYDAGMNDEFDESFVKPKNLLGTRSVVDLKRYSNISQL